MGFLRELNELYVKYFKWWLVVKGYVSACFYSTQCNVNVSIKLALLSFLPPHFCSLGFLTENPTYDILLPKGLDFILDKLVKSQRIRKCLFGILDKAYNVLDQQLFHTF